MGVPSRQTSAFKQASTITNTCIRKLLQLLTDHSSDLTTGSHVTTFHLFAYPSGENPLVNQTTLDVTCRLSSSKHSSTMIDPNNLVVPGSSDASKPLTKVTWIGPLGWPVRPTESTQPNPKYLDDWQILRRYNYSDSRKAIAPMLTAKASTTRLDITHALSSLICHICTIRGMPRFTQ